MAKSLSLNLGAEELVRGLLRVSASSYPILLDSCKYQRYGLYEGRYLLGAFAPKFCLRASGRRVELLDNEGVKFLSEDPFTELDRLLLKHSCADFDTPFGSGVAAGFLSYDLGRQVEQLPATARVTHSVPDLLLCFYDQVLVHDYLENSTTVYACDEVDLDILDWFWSQPQWVDVEHREISYESNFTQEAYVEAVKRIQKYIYEGDIYQANLTQQFKIDLGGRTAEEIFLRIRADFPVPFAAFFKTPQQTVVSASPESFLHKRGRGVSTFPIKGTRPRGRDADEDRFLTEQLRKDEKDVAENVMIVDLMRNDLGRVAEIGSVDASEILKVEAFPTVLHLVSRVSCRLRAGVTIGELLKAVFPCGSITGAPKLRAMEIIEQVEAVRRGLSMGAIGWIGYNGNADLSVAIRTLLVEAGVGYLNVGGAVVADSDPESEYQESLLKAKAIFGALSDKVDR